MMMANLISWLSTIHKVNICASMLQGDSRSPVVYMQLTAKVPLIFADKQDCSSSSEVDLYLAATNLYIDRKPFSILEAAVQRLTYSPATGKRGM